MTYQVRSDDVLTVLQLLGDRLGYTFRRPGSFKLQQFLKSRAAALGDGTVAEYVARCERDAMEFQQVINVVTNGLTAFYRDRDQLDAIRNAIENGATQIWCAGCSTGEEAFTISAIAHEVGKDVSILATDVNTAALARARTAQYDAWSLRSMRPEEIEATLNEHPDQTWSVQEHLVSPVRFEHHNLLQTPPVAEADIIVCRNVLIYFGEAAIDKSLNAFRGVLGDDGLLILGSTEQLLNRHPFEISPRADGFAYQPKSGFVSMPSMISSSAIDGDVSEMMTHDALLSIVESGIDHARKGDHETAIACFEGAVAYDPFWADLHAMTGICLEETEAFDRAAMAYHKAIFLDPQHWWSAYRSAVIWCGLGELGTARRFAKTIERRRISRRTLDPHLAEFVSFDPSEVDMFLDELESIR